MPPCGNGRMRRSSRSGRAGAAGLGRQAGGAPFLSARVTDRFDVVAVGVEHERAVVRRVVVLADPGPTVVVAARLEPGGVEGVDGRAVRAVERDVRAGAVRLA